MDLSKLLQEEVLSDATFGWIKPLWEKEQADLRELEEEKARNSLLNFGGNNSDEEDDYGGGSDDDTLIENGSLQLEGVYLTYQKDVQSVGHGNRVWHASIATCLYLKDLCERMTSIDTLNTFRSLELGAGTALPSLFLAHKISGTDSSSGTGRPNIHITDAKEYRNIRQILVSVSQQPTSVREAVNFKVAPHNWGEGISIHPSDSSKKESFWGNENTHPNSYDLVIVSDCMYNPQYHNVLLKSIAATMKLPSLPSATENQAYDGGRTIIAFSLHGNTEEQHMWNFLWEKVPKERKGCWQLFASPIKELKRTSRSANSTSNSSSVTTLEMVDPRGGWHMEETMRELDLWTANIADERWIAFAFEIKWSLSIE